MKTKTTSTSWRNDDDFDNFSFGEILMAVCAFFALCAIFVIALYVTGKLGLN